MLTSKKVHKPTANEWQSMAKSLKKVQKQNKELTEQIAEVIWMNTALTERLNKQFDNQPGINKILSEFFSWTNAAAFKDSINDWLKIMVTSKQYAELSADERENIIFSFEQLIDLIADLESIHRSNK